MVTIIEAWAKSTIVPHVVQRKVYPQDCRNYRCSSLQSIQEKSSPEW